MWRTCTYVALGVRELLLHCMYVGVPEFYVYRAVFRDVHLPLPPYLWKVIYIYIYIP